MKVVAEIESFRTNHARPAGSAWKYTKRGHKVVGETSKCGNAIGIRTPGLAIPTLTFRHIWRQHESCRGYRALSNEICATVHFCLEVPQWIDFCSRGNLRFLKSYCSLSMYIWHHIFDFFVNLKPEKIKVVAEIKLFQTNHTWPADSAWKCPNRGHKVVGGTSKTCECHRYTCTQIRHPDVGFFFISDVKIKL